MIRALATAAVVLAVMALARVGRAGFYAWCRGRYATSQWCADRLTAAADRRWSRCVRLVPPGTDMHIASEGRARSIRFIPYSAKEVTSRGRTEDREEAAQVEGQASMIHTR